MRYKIKLNAVQKNDLYKLGFSRNFKFPTISFLKCNIDYFKFSIYYAKNSLRFGKCVHCNSKFSVSSNIDYYMCSSCNKGSKLISNNRRKEHIYISYSDIYTKGKILKYRIHNCSTGQLEFTLIGIADQHYTYARFSCGMYYEQISFNTDNKWRVPGKKTRTYTEFYNYSFYKELSKLNKKQRKLINNNNELIIYKDYLEMLNTLKIPKMEKWVYNSKYNKLHDYFAKLIKGIDSKTKSAQFQQAVRNLKDYKNLYVIRTLEGLKRESDKYNHCVNSYDKKVINRECVIYHYDDGIEDGTVEVKNNTIVQARKLDNECIIDYINKKYKTLNVAKW